MAKKSKSSLADRINKENARENSRGAAAKAPGGGSLPAGIDNGVAKLTRVDFDEIKNGEYAGSQRFYSHGTCVSPASYDGVKTEGKLVQLGSITLEDTKAYDGSDVSFAENVAKAENRLKLLGFPTEDFDDLEEETLDFFEEEKDSMYFSFRTWKPDNSDRVLVTLVGATNWEGETDDEVEEDIPLSRKKKKEVAVAAKTAAPEEVEEEEEKVTLQDLAKKADEGDEDCQLKIVARAEKVGIDSEDPEYDDWSDVVNAIESLSNSSEEPDEEEDEDNEGEDEDSVPEEGDVLGYKPPKGKEVLECEVTKVYPKKQKCDLICIETDKKFKGVVWDKLIFEV